MRDHDCYWKNDSRSILYCFIRWISCISFSSDHHLPIKNKSVSSGHCVDFNISLLSNSIEISQHEFWQQFSTLQSEYILCRNTTVEGCLKFTERESSMRFSYRVCLLLHDLIFKVVKIKWVGFQPKNCALNFKNNPDFF